VRHYAAPWGRVLTLLSMFATLICIFASYIVWQNGTKASGEIAAWAALIPIAVLLIALLFVVRGYEITPDEILVERLLWRTRLEPRSQLQSATVDPEAMKGAIRVFGNGGLFAFTGLFRSKSLGKFRVFVTDPGRAVVLRFPNRVVVVSPSDPERFAREVMPY
jgi:hypothetical protein